MVVTNLKFSIGKNLLFVNMKEESIWNELYKSKIEVDKQPQIQLGLIMHPYCAELCSLFVHYEKFGYPLGKTRKGWKKWYDREAKKIRKKYE